jgi:hypothetical protein
MPAGARALALLPLLSAFALVLRAASEDSYYGDGRSHWETHPGGPQALLLVALAANVIAAAVLLRRRGGLVLGGSLLVVALVLALLALIQISGN